ncbi:MAG: hypothetical protein CVU18_05675 [Betaproteobacteria bacterium HGW-Betaproteobacteria-12]|nr:MAG: hypothetical protein CVU18_05675 [Betaproteobacteria bacterium HGW-Betaproteobacteria-12]
MTEDQNQIDPTPNSTETSQSLPHQSKRRKLIKSGIGASAMVAIAASRSAWGGDKCTRSGLDSANLSGQHTFDGCGKSAGYWKTHDWPSSVSKSAAFTGIFGSYNYKDQVLYAGKTLFEVIMKEGASDKNPSNLGKHLIGAFVNAFAYPNSSPSGKGFVYTPEKVISMFQLAALSPNPGTAFSILKDTLQEANNKYDGDTDKYVDPI